MQLDKNPTSRDWQRSDLNPDLLILLPVISSLHHAVLCSVPFISILSSLKPCIRQFLSCYSTSPIRNTLSSIPLPKLSFAPVL